MNDLDALRLALDATGAVLAADPITPAQAATPTPCHSYAVADLADHVRDTHLLLTGAARATTLTDSRPLAACYAELSQHAFDAWKTRGVDGTVDVAGNQLPASFALALHLVETYLHGWDLAKALDRPFRPAEDLDTHLWSILPAVVQDDARGGDGEAPYGPRVDVDPEATLIDKIVAYSGRQPSWTAAVTVGPEV